MATSTKEIDMNKQQFEAILETMSITDKEKIQFYIANGMGDKAVKIMNKYL